MLPDQKEPAGAAVRSETEEENVTGENRSVEPAESGPDLSRTPGGALTGRQIGRYLIGGRLGRGGTASVYRAYDQIQERTVALKILSQGADDAVRSRFQMEARTVASLRHPHIVQTLQVGNATGDGAAYIAMELVDGDSLDQLLKRRGRLSVAECCNLLAPIARALDYAHQQDIIHRDVKPSNILLRPFDPGAFGSPPSGSHSASAVHEAERILIGAPSSGEFPTGHAAGDLPVAPLLSDFGIARALDMPELTNVGRTIGTPAYMAPEQCASSREVTGRADIYALGAVLYRCLVGRPPFTGSTTQILHAHVYASLSLPDDLLAALPPELVAVMRRCLAKDPEERYAVARELADDLSAIAGRIASLESALAEQTSTLTLVSLPAVGLPPSSSHTTETVIVPGAESRLEGALSQNLAQQRPSGQDTQPAPAGDSTRSRRPLMVTVLSVLLTLGLLAIGVFVSGTLRERAPSEAAQNQDNSDAPAPSLPAAEQQPNAAEAVDGQVAAGNTASESEAQSASAPPAVPVKNAAGDCQYQIAVEFQSFLGENESIAQELGCPRGVPVFLAFETQFFQTGMALGRLDKPIVYLRYFSNDEWEQREHAWREGMQEVVDSPDLLSPAGDLYQPVRGIGQIWPKTCL
ncbi:MAG: serine/threonine protein kinase [Caldilineaceae bacterium SB0661_bin_32]|uniref:non-specific serine/threonine protein kinase n=1 Tax=Caldilineaceae bacterium SB0661_bin_32 TaxID=2605255 RepID=A0A6B1DBF3_9CHLR|nr:serine/threonine protein kinase [Caldilineaceae bacterium SB0661_bin_32]